MSQDRAIPAFAKLYQHIDLLKDPFPFTLTYRDSGTLPTVLHAHDFYQFCYVLGGSCIHDIHDTQVVLSKGDFFSVPPYMSHSLRRVEDQDVSIAQIDFKSSFLEEHLTYAEQLDGIVDFAYFHPLLHSTEQLLPKLNLNYDSQRQVEQLIDHMRIEIEEQRPMYQLAVRAEMLKLLIIAGREFNAAWEGREEHGRFKRKKQALLQAIEYIDNHFTEELHLADVAEKAFMAPAYFSSVFKAMTGQNFTAYVNGMRVKKAQELLKSTTMLITEIHLACGFNQASHFIDTFKRHTGVTPSAYRKRASEV
ncbi:helix-turn-helix domain-containing protein [Paenibacillus sp. GCM10023252]|uniref:helix-turn-helix domain-containing protein n=1 Tax=Paenibacillus sp. GCM10023252 TaxID=3252649 RepID=UPI003615BF66